MKQVFKTLFAMVLLLIAAVPSFCQVENYNKGWIQGLSITYKTTFTTNGPVNELWDTVSNREFDFGHSGICNGAGNTILLTDVTSIYDGNNNLIDNGDSLASDVYINEFGWTVATQQSIILPLGDSIYYVIAGSWSDTAAYRHAFENPYDAPGFDQLRYHVVDMKENSYQGRVTKKNRMAMSGVFIDHSHMTAVRHGNGRDWWVTVDGVDLDWDTTTLYSFWIQKDTVFGPYIQSYNHPATPGGPPQVVISAFGQSSFSNDGELYASVTASGNDFFSLAEFDRCSGLFSNHHRVNTPIQLPYVSGIVDVTDTMPVSLCFSPNDSFLYVNTPYSIFQWEIHNPDSATAWAHIANLDTIESEFRGYMTMYQGHDGKIYIGNRSGLSNTMSVIDNPNGKGAAANFCPKCLRFPPVISLATPYGWVQQPPNMPNYVLGSRGDCFTALPEPKPSTTALTLYPNPADATLTIEVAEGGYFEVVDMLGRVVITSAVKQQATLSTSTLPSGVYTYRFTDGKKQVSTGKVIISH